MYQEKKLVIGIDIGGTTTKLGLVDAEGHILTRFAFPTQEKKGSKAFSQATIEAVRQLIDDSGRASEIGAIGIGAPGVDEQAGTIAAAANLPFEAPIPLADILEQYFQLPCRLIKDSSAAAYGEKQFGGARGMDNFVLLTLGTGLGSALMIHGQIVSGGSGLASEYGHSTAERNGRYCNCGKKGCLETYVSATGIRRTVMELMAQQTQDSPLRHHHPADIDAKMISDAALAGDQLALDAFRFTGDILGRAIADLVHLLDPQAVFLAGGLIQAGPLLFNPTLESMDRYLLNMFKGSCPVLPSKLGGEDTGILGAAAIMWINPKNPLNAH